MSIHEGKVFSGDMRLGRRSATANDSDEETFGVEYRSRNDIAELELQRLAGEVSMPKGMFVDTSICIGYKACQVACKEWNELGGEPEHFKNVGGKLKAVNFTGDSYDNTGSMSATNWRQVRFIERGSVLEGNMAWYMMSGPCKHCNQAGCLEVCPTHALMRTELGNVVVQQDVCNGCRACIPACPFGVISHNKTTGRVNNKCTLCNDRISQATRNSSRQVCPTDLDVYGDVDAMRVSARKRVDTLKSLDSTKRNSTATPTFSAVST